MKEFFAVLFVAALVCVGVIAVPSPAHAVTETTYHAVPEGYNRQLAVKVTAHNVGTGDQIVVDKIELDCTTGCGPAGTYRFRDIRIEVRGPGGDVKWSKSSVDVPSGGAGITFWPNVQVHKNGYWWANGAINDDGPYNVFRECWKAWPSGSNAAHPYCIFLG